jgi:hypothetical protein
MYKMIIQYALVDGCGWTIRGNNDILLESGCLDSLIESG